MQEITVIGLMSGTSLDGIDAAAIVTNGEEVLEIGPALTLPYNDDLRERLHEAVMAHDVTDPDLERDMTFAHYAAIQQLEAEFGVEADLIGFHGQTIAHRPDEGFTWQIGDGRLLADLTGIDVVNDFRTADVHAGGQGAPLVPVFHGALAKHLPKPLAFLNIGGVANFTYVGEKGELLAFDCGAGNALINDVMKQHFGVEFDEDGKLARQGKADAAALAQLLQHEFFAKRPPKSLDRNDFDLSAVAHLAAQDQVATLTQFSVEAILLGTQHFPQLPQMVYVCGGGRHNKHLMQLLAARLGEGVEPIDTLGLDGDAIEAQAFAFLAARVKYELPISFPSTTGCSFSPVGNAGQMHSASQ